MHYCQLHFKDYEFHLIIYTQAVLFCLFSVHKDLYFRIFQFIHMQCSTYNN